MRSSHLLLIAALALSVLGSTRTSNAMPVRQDTPPTSTATPRVSERPDRCEPNPDRRRACALAINTVNGPYTVLPPGDQDYYRLVLDTETRLETTITVRGTADLDLITTITRDDGTALAAISSPAISITLAADSSGGIILRVENRAPDDPIGDSYTIEIRRTLPHPPATPPTGPGMAVQAPDLLENNWNIETAAPIAVGVLYELNFTCPVVWGCAGGDHEYLRLPVKANANYLITTFDLGPGVDTVIDLFQGDVAYPLISNDDAAPGSLLSAIRWHAPANGDAIIRIAPRNGGQTPIVPDKQAGTYRFAVALAESDLAQQLAERIAQQTNAPKPAAPSAADRGGAPPAAPAPASAMPTPATDAPKGSAVVRVATTVLREAPDARSAEIQTLMEGTPVQLLGQASRTWVRVQPHEGVIPGWIYGPDLQLTTPEPTAGGAPSALTPRTGDERGTGALGQPNPSATATPPATPQVQRLDPLPLPSLPTSAPRMPLTVSITLLGSTGVVVVQPTPGRPTPTPAPSQPLAAIRVQLVNAFGDALAEGMTPPSGQVTLSRDLAPGTAVFVRVPALGLQVALDPAQPNLTIRIAQEALP